MTLRAELRPMQYWFQFHVWLRDGAAAAVQVYLAIYKLFSWCQNDSRGYKKFTWTVILGKIDEENCEYMKSIIA